MIEKKEELINEKTMKDQVLQAYNKLVESHNRYHNKIKEYFDYFDQNSTLFDSLGNPREQSDWKDGLAMFLPLALKQLNNEEMLL